MATSAKAWLVSQLEERGWVGLESVADYLLTVQSQQECTSYLSSLLGDEAQPDELARGFWARRNNAVNNPGESKGSPDYDSIWSASSRTKKATGRKSSTDRGSSSQTPVSSQSTRQGGGPRSAGSGSRPPPANAGTGPTARVKQAQQANEIVNCLRCGKIHFKVRDNGQCEFCGVYLWANHGSLVTDQSQRQLEKLLEYDRTAAKRTVVLDDEADYFDTAGDRWLSDSEKADREAKRPQQNSRSQIRLNLDVSGGKASVEVQARGATSGDEAQGEAGSDNPEQAEASDMKNEGAQQMEAGRLRNPEVDQLLRPVFVPSAAMESLVAGQGQSGLSERFERVLNADETLV